MGTRQRLRRCILKALGIRQRLRRRSLKAVGPATESSQQQGGWHSSAIAAWQPKGGWDSSATASAQQQGAWLSRFAPYTGKASASSWWASSPSSRGSCSQLLLRIDLIKTGVEGHSPRLMPSARETLRAHRHLLSRLATTSQQHISQIKIAAHIAFPVKAAIII